MFLPLAFSRRTTMRPQLLTLLVLAGGCERSTEPQGPYCAQIEARAGEGLNPLIDGHYLCFDTLSVCSKTSSACTASGPARWFCTSIFTKAAGDPLNGDATCYPSESMCRASRMPTVDDQAVVSNCAAVASVDCSTSSDGRLQCMSDEVSCERSRDLGASVMHVKSTPCKRR